MSCGIPACDCGATQRSRTDKTVWRCSPSASSGPILDFEDIIKDLVTLSTVTLSLYFYMQIISGMLVLSVRKCVSFQFAPLTTWERGRWELDILQERTMKGKLCYLFPLSSRSKGKSLTLCVWKICKTEIFFFFFFILGEVQQLQDNKQKSSCEDVPGKTTNAHDFFCGNFLEFIGRNLFILHNEKKTPLPNKYLINRLTSCPYIVRKKRQYILSISNQ